MRGRSMTPHEAEFGEDGWRWLERMVGLVMYNRSLPFHNVSNFSVRDIITNQKGGFFWNFFKRPLSFVSRMKLLGKVSSLLCFHFCCWLCVFFPLIIVTVTLKLRRSCKLNIGAPCHHHRVVPIGKNDKDWVSCRRCLLSLNLLFSGICSVARRQKSRKSSGICSVARQSRNPA